MTHDILRSDIELATRLLAENRPDAKVIEALAQRGVDPAKAVQLVDDLRNRREVSTKDDFMLGFGAARRSRARGDSPEARQDQPSRSPKVESRPKSPRHGADRHHNKSAVAWLVPGLVAVLALVVVGIVVRQRQLAAANSAEARMPGAPMTKVDGAAPRASAMAPALGKNPSHAALVLELQPDGLHIGGRHVTAETALAAIANSLGAATRTNQIGQSDTVIYAYDQQGLMVYSQKAGGTNSIVLDCEASGGTHGTLSPFTGAITVEGQVIRTDTDRQALIAIKHLDLSHTGSDNSIWGGRYHDLGLAFSYLKTPQRLSLIKIDLQ